MGVVEQRLAELGLTLPPALEPPDGVRLPFRPVHVVGARVLVSGHGPQRSDGTIVAMPGMVGREVSLEEARTAAHQTALSVLASLRRTLGDLDRVAAWLRVFGMVRAAPGFDLLPDVINGFSDTVLDVFGAEIGAHSRSAIGVAALPFGIAVEVEAELLIDQADS